MFLIVPIGHRVQLRQPPFQFLLNLFHGGKVVLQPFGQMMVQQKFTDTNGFIQVAQGIYWVS